VLSSKKCNQQSGPPAPTPTTKQIRVSLNPNWPISWPQASNCTGTGPRIGNNPQFNNGSTSLYTSTNLRFTEVKLRNLVTNAVSSKLWANNSAAAGYEVIMDAPLNAGYEITFSQYDGCSSACLQAQTANGPRPVRLFWTKSEKYGLNASTYITLTPNYFGAGNQVCN
jgi:hypothetical protein